MFDCGRGHRCAFRPAAAGLGYGDEPAGEQPDGGRRRTANLRRNVPDVPWAAGVGDPGRGGPALNTTGLKHGDGDADLFRTIRQGVSGTQMPPYKGLRDEQVWQLVSYIRSLQNRGASPAAARGAMVARRRRRGGRSALLRQGRMRELSRDQRTRRRHGSRPVECRPSHGGRDPPEDRLAERSVAARARRAWRRRWRGRGAPPPVTIVAKMPDGREIRGVRRNEDMFSAQVVDASGQLHLSDKLQAPVTVENRSLMPGDYAKRLSADDITNIVGFLRMQQGRDQNKTSRSRSAAASAISGSSTREPSRTTGRCTGATTQGTHYSPLDADQRRTTRVS